MVLISIFRRKQKYRISTFIILLPCKICNDNLSSVILTNQHLIDKWVDNVALHLKNIFETDELDENATSEDLSVVRKEGDREVSRSIKHYNLDAVIAVGYRVNSICGTQFRIWATQRIKEYLTQGFRFRSFYISSLLHSRPTHFSSRYFNPHSWH